MVVPLEEYRRKRKPGRTPEPVPNVEPAPGDPSSVQVFVIQEHHARALHWDLRLERDGVLASWAVPKGLPADPDAIRLAVRTEDHPMEYADFSGEVPAGEYGAGHLTIWDRGTYETIKWTDQEVQFVLHGDRVAGRYVLLRKGREPKNWLLRRMDAAIGVPLPPHDLSPMLASAGSLPSDDEGWCYEVRFGGSRVIAAVDGGRVRLTGPDDEDLTGRYPEVGGLGSALGSTRLLLDGEVGGSPPGLWISDLLHLDGRDCLPLPYTERRALAESLPLAGPHWRLTPSYSGGGAAVLAAAAEQGLPVVVAKRADSGYQPGAGGWIEISTGIPKAPTEPPIRHGSGAADDGRGAAAAGGSRSPGRGVLGVEVAGRRVRLTNPDKVLYPASMFRKRDVLAHYLGVAEVMLPHLAGRPVTLRRWPDGVECTAFFEKNVARHVPDWVRTVRLDSPGSSRGTGSINGGAIDYPLIDDAAGLAWVANLAALELHVPQWTVGPDGGRQDPDLLVFDLDPGEGASVVDCARVALRVAALLADDGLTAYPRTSGGKGMQLYAPVRVSGPEQTGRHALAIAERLAADDPTRVTAVMAKQRRRGKVFIDWSQNNPAKTTVASYSLRGRPQPTVATPLTWEEVAACRQPADLTFTAADLPGRLAQHGDLMASLFTEGPRLPRSAAR